jgi:hypothetical protein
MPKHKEYENRIPAFYRKNTLDIMLFVHVTAMVARNDMEIKDAINDFFELYGISELELPQATALKVYHRVRVNFLWTSLKDSLENSNK